MERSAPRLIGEARAAVPGVPADPERARRVFWWTALGVLGAWALHNGFLLGLEEALFPGPLLRPLQLVLRAVVWLVPVGLYLRRFSPEPALGALGVTSAMDRRGLVVAAVPAAAYLALAAALVQLGKEPSASLFPSWGGLAALYAVVGVALEELLMRGFLLRQQQRWYSPGRAQTVTALLFAAMHLPAWIAQDGPGIGLVASFLVLVVQGAVLGFVAYRTGSILPAFAVHLANNLLAG